MSRPGNVEAVLQDIEVDGAHLHGAELVQPVKGQVKFVILVRLLNPLQELGQPGEGQPVQFLPLLRRHQVALGIEVVEVPQHETGGVAETPVGVSRLFQDVGGEPNVVPVIYRGHPQPQDFGPITIRDPLGGDDVTQGFRHLAAFAVHHEAMGQDSPIGGLPRLPTEVRRLE